MWPGTQWTGHTRNMAPARHHPGECCYSDCANEHAHRSTPTSTLASARGRMHTLPPSPGRPIPSLPSIWVAFPPARCPGIPPPPRSSGSTVVPPAARRSPARAQGGRSTAACDMAGRELVERGGRVSRAAVRLGGGWEAAVPRRQQHATARWALLCGCLCVCARGNGCAPSAAHTRRPPHPARRRPAGPAGHQGSQPPGTHRSPAGR